MRESDKRVGISRDMRRSRKPDRRNMDIAGFVFACAIAAKGFAAEALESKPVPQT